MIYTVTLNPAVDRELTVPSIEFDTVLRAAKQQTDIGGKGFNVSRMIRQLGGESVALGLVGGHAGKFLCNGLDDLGIATDFVWLAEETRTNTSIVAISEDQYLKVNETGPTVSPAEQAELVGKILRTVSRRDWCVLSGSLPPGISPSFYAELIEKLQQVGARAILDTSGEALSRGVEAAPEIVTPNLAEATELTGCADPVAAAQALRRRGARQVIITLGSRGAVLLEHDSLYQVTPPEIVERNAIGAGDALVAGIVFGLEDGMPLHEALRWGVACGTVAAGLAGTAFGDLKSVRQVFDQLHIESLPQNSGSQGERTL
ncbi:MAG: 1-phosphofructokinase [Planctomycetales bacterium]|nr:1-phosphofructokinase [Planctomycetales bacterium]